MDGVPHRDEAEMGHRIPGEEDAVSENDLRSAGPRPDGVAGLLIDEINRQDSARSPGAGKGARPKGIPAEARRSALRRWRHRRSRERGRLQAGDRRPGGIEALPRGGEDPRRRV